MSITDSDDDRVIQLLREELDRREKDKQDLCNHIKSGTIRSTGKNSFDVVCDNCGKVMGEQERRNAFGGEENPTFTSIETRHSDKEYVKKNKERGLV